MRIVTVSTAPRTTLAKHHGCKVAGVVGSGEGRQPAYAQQHDGNALIVIAGDATSPHSRFAKKLPLLMLALLANVE